MAASDKNWYVKMNGKDNIRPSNANLWLANEPTKGWRYCRFFVPEFVFLTKILSPK
jgi:hypothetical protein